MAAEMGCRPRPASPPPQPAGRHQLQSETIGVTGGQAFLSVGSNFPTLSSAAPTKKGSAIRTPLCRKARTPLSHVPASGPGFPAP